MADIAQKNPPVASLNAWADSKMEGFNQLLGKALPASVVEVVGETNTIVKLKFEMQDDTITLPQITCPVVGPEYTRFPIRAGVKGYVLPSDFYLGGVSGLGGGVAKFEQQPNLSNLVFFPIGNKTFEPTDDPDKTVIYGPTGVILRDENKRCIFTLTPDGIEITLDGQPYMSLSANGITFTFGGHSITMNNSGISIDAGSGSVNVTSAAGGIGLTSSSTIALNGGSGGVDIDGGGTGTTIDGKNFLPHTHSGVQTGGSNSGAVTP